MGAQRCNKRLLAVAWLALYYIAGIPIWWHLTTIHRPALPFDEMLAAGANVAEGQQSREDDALGLSRGVLSFSLCNADPSRGIYSWDFPALRQRFLQPAVAALRPLVSLSVQSQVLYYTAAQVNGTWSAEHQAYLLRFDDLPFFLDRSWAPDAGQLVAGSDGAGQQLTLNWMVYVPPPSQRPLRVLLPSGELSPTDSYVIPSWGGVIIHSPPPLAAGAAPGAQPSTTVLASAELEGVLGIALAQLRQHLGLPGSRPAIAAADAGGAAEGSTATCSAADSGCGAGSCLATAGAADAAAVPSAEPFAMNEVEGMLRRALAGNRAAAGGTLASLARLIQALPSLAMPDLVGAQVRKALAAHAQAALLARAGQLSSAVAASQRARETAEAAFFHHSILAQLSFPAQHKLAVYLPFFLPATLPLAIGLQREAKRALRGPLKSAV